jgi:hypothetical protein
MVLRPWRARKDADLEVSGTGHTRQITFTETDKDLGDRT